MANMLNRQPDLHSGSGSAPTIGAIATRFQTRSEWLAAHPPQRLDLSLALTAERERGGEDFRFAVREFIDRFTLVTDAEERQRSIDERPLPCTDPRHDAYLGALAEHLAAVEGLSRPAWSVEPNRFLDHFWFVSEVRDFRALAIAQAPAAFRRRGVFIPERSLHRV